MRGVWHTATPEYEFWLMRQEHGVVFDLPLRLQRAVDLRKSGMTFKQIGIAIGISGAPSEPISAQRAMGLVAKAVRMLRHPVRKNHPDHWWAMTQGNFVTRGGNVS
jgi:hypothetical protein